MSVVRPEGSQFAHQDLVRYRVSNEDVDVLIHDLRDDSSDENGLRDERCVMSVKVVYECQTEEVVHARHMRDFESIFSERGPILVDHGVDSDDSSESACGDNKIVCVSEDGDEQLMLTCVDSFEGSVHQVDARPVVPVDCDDWRSNDALLWTASQHVLDNRSCNLPDKDHGCEDSDTSTVAEDVIVLYDSTNNAIEDARVHCTERSWNGAYSGHKLHHVGLSEHLVTDCPTNVDVEFKRFKSEGTAVRGLLRAASTPHHRDRGQLLSKREWERVFPFAESEAETSENQEDNCESVAGGWRLLGDYDDDLPEVRMQHMRTGMQLLAHLPSGLDGPCGDSDDDLCFGDVMSGWRQVLVLDDAEDELGMTCSRTHDPMLAPHSDTC